MNSCPETDKIRALRSGNLTEEEARSLRQHVEQCPACLQELGIENEIDRELSREFIAPEIEGSVIRELKTRELAAAGGSNFFHKYLLYAALIMVFGLLVWPYLLRLPTDRISRLISADRVRPLVDAFRSNLTLTIGIGAALMAVTMIVSIPKFRKALEL